MAILNGLYIHVVDESVSRSVDSTSHPVEDGLPLTDTVRAEALTISLSGKIVDYGSMKATDVNQKIHHLMNSGSLVSYKGRNAASNMQILSFDTTHPNTNAGGANFSMELKQVRIAKSSYVPKPATTPAQKQEHKKAPEIKVGSICVFKGGSVYVSSDATKAAATRGRSTCKCTKINKVSWAKHQYHLISTDGKMVYGWVDYANIEGAETSSTSGQTNGGTQQVVEGTGTAVYHTVKSGETIYGLVKTNYKDLGSSCQWVIDHNPKAFIEITKKIPGLPDAKVRNLRVGAKLLMGYRK